MPTYRPNFDERKATHLAAYLLQKSKSSSLYLIKLMKLLYITDRESLQQLGHPVTYDTYVSMDNGPVLSHTLNLMNGMVQDHAGIWDAMISDRNDNKIAISDDCEVSYDSLSEAELGIADQVFKKYGHVPRFDLVKITHTFPEWQNPEGSVLNISHEDILKATDLDDGQIEAILSELSGQGEIQALIEVA